MPTFDSAGIYYIEVGRYLLYVVPIQKNQSLKAIEYYCIVYRSTHHLHGIISLENKRYAN